MAHYTINDIAKMAGVSKATVSRALSGNNEVSEATRARIRSICDSVGYTPNMLAQSMTKKRSFSIGMVLPDISNSFFSDIALSAESYASERNYSIFICNSQRDPAKDKKYFLLLASRQVDGIIYYPTYEASFGRDYINAVPTVVLGDNLGVAARYNVRIDHTRGTYLAAKHMIELGHKTLAFFAFKQNSATDHAKLEGFLQAMHEFGTSYKVLTSPYSHSSIEYGYLLGKKMLPELKPLPTAVCTVTDTMALGFGKAAAELGLRIPDDISLAGYDNVPFANLPQIMLTTVGAPSGEIGEKAVSLLLDVINNNPDPVQIVIEPSLVVRNTTRRIAGA